MVFDSASSRALHADTPNKTCFVFCFDFVSSVHLCVCYCVLYYIYIYIHDSHSVWRFQTSIGLVVILFGIATIKRERQKQKENIKIGAAIYEANAQAKQIFFGKTRKKYQHINDHNLWSYFFLLSLLLSSMVSKSARIVAMYCRGNTLVARTTLVRV